MRKRRVSADRPEPEDDEASPTKRRGLGKNVGVAVARIEAVEAAAKQIGDEAPKDRHCAFCAQPGNEHGRRSRKFIDWKLCRVLYDANGREIRRPQKDLFPVLGAFAAEPATADRPAVVARRAERQPRYPRELLEKRAQCWPNGDCPTPHWACWTCSKVAKNSVRVHFQEFSALAKWSILGFGACSPPPTP